MPGPVPGPSVTFKLSKFGRGFLGGGALLQLQTSMPPTSEVVRDFADAVILTNERMAEREADGLYALWARRHPHLLALWPTCRSASR